MMAMFPGSNMQDNYVNMQLIYVMFMLACQMNLIGRLLSLLT